MHAIVRLKEGGLSDSPAADVEVLRTLFQPTGFGCTAYLWFWYAKHGRAVHLQIL